MAKAKAKLELVPDPPLKLDLGCGGNKREGFQGVDRSKVDGVDYVHDLTVFPWPFADASVGEVHCSHFFEHIPGLLRPRFMDELYRVMLKDAKATIIVPYGQSNRAVQDFTHQWPPVVAESFLYFNKNWREGNKLTHGDYAMACDFDFTYGWQLDSDLIPRNAEMQGFSIKFYNNAITDMIITLTRR